MSSNWHLMFTFLPGSENVAQMKHITSNRIRRAILWPLTIALISITAVFAVFSYNQQQTSALSHHEMMTSQIILEFDEQVSGDVELMHVAATGMMDNPGLREALIAEDRDELLDLAAPHYAHFNGMHQVTHFYFIAPDGRVVLRVHQPDRYGDVLTRKTYLDAEKTGEYTFGTELGPFGTLTLRVVVPWYVDGQLIGYIKLGQENTHIVSDIAQRYDVQMISLVHKPWLDRERWQIGQQFSSVQTDFDLFDNFVVVGNTSHGISPQHLARIREFADIPDTHDGVFQYDEESTGGQFIAELLPLPEYTKQDVGHFFVIHNATNEYLVFIQSVTLIISVALLILVTLFVFFYLFIGSVQSAIVQSEEKVVETQNELSERETLLKEAQTIAKMGSWSLDLKTNNLIWTDQIYRIFGIDPEKFEASYEAFLEAIHPDDRAYVDEQYQGALEGKFPYDIRHRIIRRDNGEMRWVHERCEHLRDENGTVIRSDGTVQDITERVEAEDRIKAAKIMEATSQAKAEFLANMSHEIRTPMNGVVGMIDLLMQMEQPPNQRQMLWTIRNSSYSLLRIIDDILDTSKIEAGKLSIEHIPTDLEMVVEGAVSSIVPVADEKNVTVRLHLDPELPKWITTDPDRLRQILINMLSNAVKFSSPEDGKSEGRVLVKVEPDGKKTLRISVQDNGIGMSQEKADSLFAPFVQADSSTSRRFGGTGLGLTICKNLSELMGGSISAESIEGEGATFTVLLPIIRAKGKNNGYKIQPLDVVALVDDPDDQNAIAAYLKYEGLSCRLAKNKDDAIVQLAEQDDDAILLVNLKDDDETWRIQQELAGQDYTRRFLIFSASRSEDFGPSGNRCIILPKNPITPSTLKSGLATLTETPDGAVDAPEPTVDDIKGSIGKLGDFKVLIVEDNEINQIVMEKQMSMLGCATEIASNGQEGLDKWREGGFDLLLVDCHMPVMDGFDMTRNIRSEEAASEGGAVPIIAITANALKDDADLCIAVGMNDVLTKPVELKRLSDTLQKWLTQA